MAYGYDGNMSALDWVVEVGPKGLREADKKSLQEAGILLADGSVHQEQLELAQKHQYTGGALHAN